MLLRLSYDLALENFLRVKPHLKTKMVRRSYANLRCSWRFALLLRILSIPWGFIFMEKFFIKYLSKSCVNLKWHNGMCTHHPDALINWWKYVKYLSWFIMCGLTSGNITCWMAAKRSLSCPKLNSKWLRCIKKFCWCYVLEYILQLKPTYSYRQILWWTAVEWPVYS